MCYRRSQNEQLQAGQQSGTAGSIISQVLLQPAVSLIQGSIPSSSSGPEGQGIHEVSELPSFPQHQQQKPTMLVFMLGGLTMLEIAAFRYLSKDPLFPYEIIMASTGVTNSSKFIKDLSHELK